MGHGLGADTAHLVPDDRLLLSADGLVERRVETIDACDDVALLVFGRPLPDAWAWPSVAYGAG